MQESEWILVEYSNISQNVTVFHFVVIEASVSISLFYQEDDFLSGFLVTAFYKFKVLGGVKL